jgi:hypothetical protein
MCVEAQLRVAPFKVKPRNEGFWHDLESNRPGHGRNHLFVGVWLV